MPRNSLPADFDIRDNEKILIPPHIKNRYSVVPNFSRILLAQSQVKKSQATKNLRAAPSHISAMRSTRKASGVRRWDPKSNMSSEWDGLRHDKELWQADGDCAVHLYGQGKSKRGASIKIYTSDLKMSGCQPLLNTLVHRSASATTEHSLTQHWDTEIPSTPSDIEMSELYIPALEDAVREDAFRWHVTTRNFFAWLSNKPLVGSNLARVLTDLLERMQIYRSEGFDNIQDLLLYAERQGYLNFVSCPDHALAFLQFAENFKLRDLWLNAFAHCVGMNDRLDLSLEFDGVSRVTKALITRAYLEMDLHLGRASKSLRNFLEDELSPTYLGIPAAARTHLDRFRSFLHSFYINKFGYWPPEQNPVLSMELLREMKFEFQQLYDYLVDKDSSSSAQGEKQPPTGGICVRQNVDAFNTRHNYEPLPHALPLLPSYPYLQRRTSSQKGLRSLRLSSKPSKFDQIMTVRTALATSTNTGKSECALVREYRHLEQSSTSEEKVSVVDARKVRWIVVYGILQMLVNAVKAPREVRDADDAPYHLCLLTTGTPPWSEIDSYSSPPRNPTNTPIQTPGQAEDKTPDVEISSTLSIHPDCEDDDYFSHKSMTSRIDSGASLRPAPLRINTSPVNRTSSIRTLHRSITSNFSLPTRRSSIRSSGFFSSQSAPETPVPESASPLASKRLSGFSFAISEDDDDDLDHPIVLPNITSFPRTPTLDAFMLDALSSSPSSTSSEFSMFSPVSAASSWTSDDMDSFSNNSPDRYSKGIYSMDHESVYSSHSRKASGASSPSTPTSNLSNLTVSSAAAATAKLIDLHAASGSQDRDEADQFTSEIEVPSWHLGEKSSQRTFVSYSKHDSHPYGVSVPQDVPEDDVMGFESHEDSDVEACVDIFSALKMLPA